MNHALLPMLLTSWVLLAQPPSPEARKWRLNGVIEVGSVFDDCVRVQKSGHPAESPMGFLIPPDRAFRLALEKIKFRCPSKFGHVVFADDGCYYITVGPLDAFPETLTPAVLAASTIRVQGLTGRVFPPANPR
jgi:hypothetical protein